MARPLAMLLVLAFAPLAAAEQLMVAPDLYSPAVEADRDPERAATLLVEAEQAADAGEVSLAMQLATRVLRHDPDEPTCRNVLGYQLVDGRWLTMFQKKQIERGYTWHARFGWQKAEDLPRYEAGERRIGRRWLSAEQDAERHASIDDGWRVRTDHFQVTTNHSLEAAARLGAELERFYQVWRQLFAGYHLGADEVRRRFEGTRTARTRSRPYNIFFHKTRDGYIAALRHKQPRIDESLGNYFYDTREAHFFAIPTESGAAGFSLATLYHEAAHQLFQESQKTRRQVGVLHDFWAVEGVATYFESLRPTGDGGYSIGGLEAGRLAEARDNLAGGYLVPLNEMTSLARDDLQRRPDIQALYAQMAGVATYLMHADGGRRREALVAYLRNLYTGRARDGALWETLGESAVDLQPAYQRWLAGQDGERAGR